MAKDEGENLQVDVKLRARRQSRDECMSGPGSLLHQISSTQYGPYVVLPNATIITAQGQHGREFDNDNARIFAEQNDGIFFAKVDSSDPKRHPFLFKDFLRAVKILSVNSSKPEIRELAEDPETWRRLEQVEGKYLMHVTPLYLHDIFNGTVHAEGLTGMIEKQDERGYWSPRYFGPNRNHFQVEMGLVFDSFGYSGFGVREKILQAEIEAVPGRYEKGAERTPEEISAIQRFLNVHRKGISYKWSNSDDKSKPADKIKLTMRSPKGWYTSSREMPPPKASTEMVHEFIYTASQLATAFLEMEKRGKARREYEEQEAYSLIPWNMDVERVVSE